MLSEMCERNIIYYSLTYINIIYNYVNRIKHSILLIDLSLSQASYEFFKQNCRIQRGFFCRANHVL